MDFARHTIDWLSLEEADHIVAEVRDVSKEVTIGRGTLKFHLDLLMRSVAML
jgi:hypothetical protein